MGLLGQRPRTVLLTAIAVAEDQPWFPRSQVTRPHRGPRMYVGIHILQRA